MSDVRLVLEEATLGVWKSLYCESNFHACERLKLFHAKQIAPLNLLPNGRMLNLSAHEEPS
jgi:hypothetical protein